MMRLVPCKIFRFAGGCCSFIALLVGCSRYQPGTEKSWTVGSDEVYETIQQSQNNWPDAVFLRTYRLQRGGQTVTVGSYENETQDGVIDAPYAVGDYIVIPTSSYIYRIGPDNLVNEFYPSMADQWIAYSEPFGINGHYDYFADKVEHVNGAWRLTFALAGGLDGRRPKTIRFVTTDDWSSFQIETDDNKAGQ